MAVTGEVVPAAGLWEFLLPLPFIIFCETNIYMSPHRENQYKIEYSDGSDEDKRTVWKTMCL